MILFKLAGSALVEDLRSLWDLVRYVWHDGEIDIVNAASLLLGITAVVLFFMFPKTSLILAAIVWRIWAQAEDEDN